MTMRTPEPILVSDPGEEPVFSLICLIKGAELQELTHRLGALAPPRSEYLVVLAEKLDSGEFALCYHDTYRGAVMDAIDQAKRIAPSLDDGEAR